MLMILALSLVVLIIIGMPLGFAIIISSMAAIFLGSDINPLMIPQRLFAGMDSFSLLAIPFFLLAGALMTAGGLSDRIIGFANALVGRFRGGLAISNVTASVFFGGISGSAVADTSAIGGTFIPAMSRLGYKPAYSVAVTACSAPMSPMIPPSIAWIIYGFLTDQSVLRLFLAGIIPGLFWAGAIIAVIIIQARRLDLPTYKATTPCEIWAAFRHALTALMMPLIILAGILLGIFTVTEASAVAVIYALFVGTVVHRELTPRSILRAVRQSIATTAVVMIIIGSANLFAWVLAYAKAPEHVATWITTITDHPIGFLLLVNLMLLVLGTFMETNAAKVMVVPILFPIAVSLGVDPIHFGVIITANLCLGLITPPVGIVLALACRIGDIRLDEGVRAAMPFILASAAVVLILTLVPGLSLWLPNLLLD
ncbi:TRAP transporter large permease [Acuticoccus sp. M5D2P5]|uniref:TRAP transporter large permease n=1 Tax=Acuticoccus kalidii TaxID=2910977 RepID=UPI001F25528A|nr:TRAP transporter large permease [Acuticoccus kalidii]MCF3933429.1 TRAP transporter large permease [Acuticoccus kalidii]